MTVSPSDSQEAYVSSEILVHRQSPWYTISEAFLYDVFLVGQSGICFYCLTFYLIGKSMGLWLLLVDVTINKTPTL